MAIAASKSGHGHGAANWKLSPAVAYDGKDKVRKAIFWVNEYLKFRHYDTSAGALKKRIEEKINGRTINRP